ncbi:MAG: VanW family protein [Clostridium sp.]|uniref:VanW family protein n=2 Tax=Clostridium sp. TaxID=1506 RepID=UPI00306C8ECB
MKNRFKMAILFLIIILFIIIVIIGLRIGLAVKANANIIYKGITINGIDVSLLNMEQAIEKIKQNSDIVNENRKISVNVEEKSYNTSFVRLKVRENIEEVVKIALYYGKSDDILKRYKWIKYGIIKDFTTSITLDAEEFKEFLKNIEKEQNIASVDATIDHQWGEFRITPHEIGRSIDRYELKKNIENQIEESKDGVDISSEAMFIKEYPKIMDSDIKSINSLISSYTTGFINSSSARCKNIEIAAKSIDNTVVLPGEEFSFNNIVGMATSSKGYQYAKVIKNGIFIEEVGGGICQVSSTLYNAVLKSRFSISERRNHSKVISYVPRGQDAMISYGVSDLKFVNTFNYPILIETIVANKEITINIFSNKNESGTNYEVVSEVGKLINPKKEIIYDYGLREGTVIIQQQGEVGYVIDTYRVLYKNGKLVEKIKVGESIYQGKNIIIRKGKD